MALNSAQTSAKDTDVTKLLGLGLGFALRSVLTHVTRIPVYIVTER